MALAAISLIVSGERLTEAALVAHDPLWIVTDLNCDNWECVWTVNPLALPTSIDNVALADRPALQVAVTERARTPEGHWLLFASELARTLPLVVLYWTLALALLGLGRTGGSDPAAIRWLRRAATAAAVLVLAKPLAESLQATAIAPAVGGGAGWRFAIVGSDVPLDLLLVGVAWVAAWAIEQGMRARAELAEYV